MKDDEIRKAFIDARTLEDLPIMHAYSGILLRSNDGEEFGICNRDTGFEFHYTGKKLNIDNVGWYEAKEGNVSPLGPESRQQEIDELKKDRTELIAELKAACPHSLGTGDRIDKILTRMEAKNEPTTD